MHLRRRAVWLALWTIAAATGVASPPVESGGLFETHELETGVAPHQTVLPGAFTAPGHAELAVIDGPSGGDTRLTVHRLEEDGWGVARRAELAPGVLFADVVEVGGRDHVVLYRRGNLHLFDPDTAIEHVLARVTADYRAPERAGAVPRIDVIRDLNGDGRDDLVLPDPEGFWIATQRADGTFAEAIRFGPSEPHLDAAPYGEPRTYGERGITPENAPWYLGRVHRLDYDRDGRPDLAFWSGERFELHRQGLDGNFSATAETFSADVPFDFDGAYALAFQFDDAGVPSLLLGLGGRFDYTVLHGFQDLNGDGVSDLVTFALAGRRVFAARGHFDIHFGRPVPGGTAWAGAPDETVATPGPAAGMAAGYATQRYLDMDGDGATDIGLASVDTGLGGMVRALAGKSVTMDLALYRQSDGAFANEPDVERRVRTRFAPFDKRGVLFPTVLLGDVTGDGRADLLAAERWGRLSVYLGIPAPELLATEPIHVAVEVPADERNAMLADLDGDGRQDVVIHHPSDAAANRVTVLMARGEP